MNPAFRQVMGINADFEFGQPIDAYIKDPDLCQLIMDISKGDGKWAWKEPTIDLNGGEHPGYRKNAAMGCIGKHVYIFGGTAWNAEGDEVALNDVFVFEWNNKTNTLTLLPEIQVGG